MKVLFVLTYYFPHWTGLTQHAVTVAEGMAKRGHDVSVIATQHDTSLSTKECRHGVSITRLPVWFRLSRTLIAPRMFIDVVHKIREVDTVVIYIPFAELWYVAVVAKLMKKRLVLVHNGDLILPRGSFINRIVEMVYRITTVVGIALSDKTIGYTDDYAKHSMLLSRFPSRYQAIFPPIGRIPPESLRVVAFKKLLKKAGPVIGFAGRFVEEKGFDTLLDAIPIVLKRYPQAQFVFAGDTGISYESFYASCIARIQKYEHSLVMLGLLKRVEMGSFYALLDVFALPSRTECLAFVQVEAMLSGVPVVSSNVPGARIPVQKTGMGILSESNNPHSLAKAIISVLDHKKMYEEKGKRLPPWFSFSTSLDQFERAFFS